MDWMHDGYEIVKKIKTKRIKLTKKIVKCGKFPCEHCQKISNNIDDKMVESILKNLDKYNEEFLEYFDKFEEIQKVEKSLQNHIRKQSKEILSESCFWSKL